MMLGECSMTLLLFSFLSPCRLASLVDEGTHCYALMITIYMISAKLEHITPSSWFILL